MTTKRQPITASDLPPPLTTSAGAPTELIAEDLPPAQPTPQAPTRFRQIGVSTIVASAVSPRARVQLAWDPPPGVPSVRYEVRWATNTAATANVGNGFSDELTARIDTLVPATSYYFWVRTWAGSIPSPWSTRLGPILTASDDTPPAAPTSLVTSWSGLTGDLLISWTNPASANLRDVRVRIYASNGGALLHEVYEVSGRFLWTRGMHYSDTSNSPDTSVYLVLAARNWTGVFSTDLTGTATLAAPSTPSGLASSWGGDTGTAAADCRITWTASNAVALYRLSIDGVSRDVVGGLHVYTFDTNRAEHSGTPDPVLSLSLTAIDALGQASAAATLTATNAAPPATSISVFGAFTMVSLTIGASAAQDLQDYRIRVYVASVLTRTIYLTALNTTYAVEDGNGNYTFDVAVRDRFGQIGTASSQTAPVELVDQGEFIADLRAGLSYHDSVSTAPATLDGLKNDDTSTNVVTYTSSTPWRWTEGIRALEVRHRKSTLSTSASASYYYGISVDGTTYTWYAGGTATGGLWSPVAQASEAAAQTAATTLAAGIWKISLAATVEGRYFRLGHRNTGASYALREFYPRSLVEADDINVESLAAISANLGTITAGSITGVTITGGTIRTAASGSRVEMSSGALKAYSSDTQVRTKLDEGGLTIYDVGGLDNNAVFYRRTDNDHLFGRVSGDSASTNEVELVALAINGASVTSSKSSMKAVIEPSNTNSGTTSIVITRTSALDSIALNTDTVALNLSSLNEAVAIAGAGGLTVDTSIAVGGGINLGTATGAANGTLYATMDAGADYLTVIGNTVPTGKRGVYLTYDSVNDRANLVARHTGTADKPLIILSSQLSFFGVTPVSRQSVTALSMSVGTGSDTVADVGASFNQTTLNNNFRDLVDKVNAIRTALVSYGLLQ